MLWASHQPLPDCRVHHGDALDRAATATRAASSPTSCSSRPSSTSSTTRCRSPRAAAAEMHRTNYSGLAPEPAGGALPADVPGTAHRRRADADEHDGRDRRARMDGDEVVLTLGPQDRRARRAALRRGAAGHRLRPPDAPDGPRPGRRGPAGRDRGQPQLPAAAAAGPVRPATCRASTRPPTASRTRCSACWRSGPGRSSTTCWPPGPPPSS